MYRIFFFLALIASLTAPATAATCRGKFPCAACSDCSECAYCRRGGKCGTCRARTQSRPVEPSRNRANVSPSRSSGETPRVYAVPKLRPLHEEIELDPTYLAQIRAAAAARLASTSFKAVCSSVHDGDTLAVTVSGQRISIRLYGIDAPELGQPFGKESRAYATERALNKTLTIYGKGADKYGRVLAWVFAGSECLNRDLVTDGMAWHFVKYAPKETKLGEIQSSASAEKKGLWAGENPVAPWDWRKK